MESAVVVKAEDAVLESLDADDARVASGGRRVALGADAEEAVGVQLAVV